MKNITITGQVTDAGGLSTTFTGQITLDVLEPPVFNNIIISPNPAKPGDLVTITVSATDPQAQALTATCAVGSQVATATSDPLVFTFQV